MKDRLTLRLDRDAIARAEAHAAVTGTSVSDLVARFFSSLPDAPVGHETRPDASPPTDWRDELPPITRSLVGLAEGSDVDEDDYKRHLMEKHG